VSRPQARKRYKDAPRRTPLEGNAALVCVRVSAPSFVCVCVCVCVCVIVFARFARYVACTLSQE
jgi:hypothetical protein